jgi:RNA-dependent RNA polymerase
MAQRSVLVYCPFVLLNLGQGILCRCNDDADNLQNDLWVGLRPSQRKIKHGLPDPAILIIDVIQSSHMRAPTRLSAETTTNLAEIGVPHEVFIKLGLKNRLNFDHMGREGRHI